MSYQVLARKWRPQNFSQVVGQEHILTALSNGLRENRLHHAYLFSGTRGVGKTSIARLFAKGLNCEQGITAEPCGECEHCKAIEEGNFIDLIEIDAASRTKVEDTRELLDNVQYKPVQGRYKVYLIDEVHMLSRHSFNALLKTLEEPPEYVKFLLATTDPQKLPITILSRCMQFHLKALDTKAISHHLAYILQQEKIPFEPTALDKLAKAAQGSIRDSLSLTDQAIAMSNANITTDVVATMLGLLDDNQAIDILYALQQGNGEKLMQIVQSVADKGADWDELLVEIGECLHQIAMLQLLPNPTDDESQLAFLARHISPEDVQFFYQTLLVGRKELAFAPNRRVGAEMTLLRALAFHPKLMASQAKAVQSTSAQSAQSAVKKSEDFVQMPVYSQAIGAQYKAQKQSPVVTNVANNVEHKGNEHPATAMTATATATTTTPQSTGNAALDAIEQIERLRATLGQSASTTGEKKNTNLSENTAPKLKELPIVSVRPKSKGQTDLIERLVALSNNPSSNNNLPASSAQTLDDNDGNENTDDDTEDHSSENYQWEWSNPELAETEISIRPSDIKKAILQEKTPELVAKVINISTERDEWAKIIEALDLDNLKLVKQIALNSVVLSHKNQQLQLGLRSNQQHLIREKSIEVLQEKLTAYYQQPTTVAIELNDDESLLTPLDYRRQIYQELSEKARTDLLQDKQLQLLQQAFDAKLDMDSIRPV
ncbi:DNA polymerase-3 subunit gamma/tau [Pasteurella langaaensis DSM 22999]|uniref:DNA polymerase III subunit gamma/tau n=1 Tax=Alitibacter langaaensis DSM 22999 TaxID=1122935 RepID=A0A2U0SKW3_9PAST|nr:DNA polymerase III subunit gamma/tau [Pasteurella langaaensis]PVX31960.1 DNA polymerase-3 subunit gamma/tau [Pasteurella langaaensis DSM 22999]